MPAADGDFEQIAPDDGLRSKVGPGRGPDPQAARRAERIIAGAAAVYETRLTSTVAKLQRLLDRPGGATIDATSAREIHALAHEMRGEAGIFGYRRAGEIAALLARYLEVLKDAPVDRDVVKAHVDSISLAIKEGGADSTTEGSTVLVRRLQELDTTLLGKARR